MSGIQYGDIHAAYRQLDARGWELLDVNVARHALGLGVIRRGRWWFVLFALLMLVACGEHTVPPDAPLPTCAAVGCPNNAFCRTDGVCSCPQPDGSFAACILEAP